MSNGKTTKRSLILKYFTQEMNLELYRITMIPGVDNNGRTELICRYLSQCGLVFEKLGSGTNRMAILLDGYAVKIALDRHGMIDNKREMLFTQELQPYVIKVYECMTSGLIAVTEYVSAFTEKSQLFTEYVDEVKRILKNISDRYLVGDVGVSAHNYQNWGIRRDDKSICMLDYAYIYSVRYSTFTCADDEALLQYDRNYVNLICPVCGRQYKFSDLRERITNEQQRTEIGDIRRLGYTLTQPVQELDIVPQFEYHERTEEEIEEDAEKRRRKEEKAEIKDLVERFHNGEFKRN